MRNYITAARAEKWGIDVSDAHLCETASADVDHLTKSAIYPTDDQGYPTGELRDVFDAAACAQAQWRKQNGLDGSEDAFLGGGSFMSLNLPSTSATSTDTVMAKLYSPQALTILSSHNLLNGALAAAGWVW